MGLHDWQQRGPRVERKLQTVSTYPYRILVAFCFCCRGNKQLVDHFIMNVPGVVACYRQMIITRLIYLFYRCYYLKKRIAYTFSCELIELKATLYSCRFSARSSLVLFYPRVHPCMRIVLNFIFPSVREISSMERVIKSMIF